MRKAFLAAKETMLYYYGMTVLARAASALISSPNNMCVCATMYVRYMGKKEEGRRLPS